MNAVWSVIWGATWGNNTAALEWAAVISAAGYLGRHHIGRRLGGWLARHIAEHEKHSM